MPVPANGNNVKLGKGSLFLAKIVAGVRQTLEFVGNATAITSSAEVQRSTLYSSTQKSAPKIAEHVNRVGFSLTATLSEYTLRNLEYFLLGERASATQGAAVNQTQVFPAVEVAKGAFLKLDARQISNVTLTQDGTNVLAETTDYVVYAEAGLIQLVANSPNVVDGESISVEFDRAAVITDQVRIARQAGPICYLLYKADDANEEGASAHDQVEIWRVSIAPEGELPFISDDYGSFQLSMSVIDDSANHPTAPFGYLSRTRA